MTNNSNKTTENIVNDNAVYNIVNQVVKCDCDTAKHDPADYECACQDCLDEQVDRLNEMLIQKAVQDTENRIIKLLEKEAAGFYFDRNFYAEITTNELIAKIKGEQK